MEHIPQCEKCHENIFDCCCPDFPENETYWHDTNRWGEEFLRWNPYLQPFILWCRKRNIIK